MLLKDGTEALRFIQIQGMTRRYTSIRSDRTVSEVGRSGNQGHYAMLTCLLL
jgi:hypothetical protein